MAENFSVANIKPLPGYILVEPAQGQKQTASGIYLPDSHEEKPQHGTVLAVGDATVEEGKEVKCPVKVKDHVIYKKWGGNEFKVGEIEYQILKFEDVLAQVK
ncbi:MAG TPA: co-chaperone GroES [Vitreimonas sp.]|nr:co-chaperone GroES [Vitreimonas sp.]